MHPSWNYPHKPSKTHAICRFFWIISERLLVFYVFPGWLPPPGPPPPPFNQHNLGTCQYQYIKSWQLKSMSLALGSARDHDLGAGGWSDVRSSSFFKLLFHFNTRVQATLQATCRNFEFLDVFC